MLILYCIVSIVNVRKVLYNKIIKNKTKKKKDLKILKIMILSFSCFIQKPFNFLIWGFIQAIVKLRPRMPYFRF